MVVGAFYTLSIVGLVASVFYLFVGGTSWTVNERLPIALAGMIAAMFMIGFGKLLNEVEGVHFHAKRSAEALERLAQRRSQPPPQK